MHGAVDSRGTMLMEQHQDVQHNIVVKMGKTRSMSATNKPKTYGCNTLNGIGRTLGISIAQRVRTFYVMMYKSATHRCVLQVCDQSLIF